MIRALHAYRGITAALLALLLLLAPFAAAEAAATLDATAASADVCIAEVCGDDVCCDGDASGCAQGSGEHRDCGDCGSDCTHPCGCCVAHALPARSADAQPRSIAASLPQSLLPDDIVVADPPPFDRPPR